MSNEKLTAHLIPHLRLTWKKVRKGYQAQFALALPLPEYDIRREPGPLTGEKIMQAATKEDGENLTGTNPFRSHP